MKNALNALVPDEQTEQHPCVQPARLQPTSVLLLHEEYLVCILSFYYDVRSVLASPGSNKTDAQLDLDWDVETKGELMNLDIVMLDKNLIPETKKCNFCDCLRLSSIEVTAVPEL